MEILKLKSPILFATRLFDVVKVAWSYIKRILLRREALQTLFRKDRG